MRLELTGRSLDITPAIRRLVDAKLARLDRMLNDSALSTQIVLSKQKHGYRADVTVHARGEKFLHGVGRADVLQGCLSEAFEKIAQQAQKVKGKWQDRKRRGPAKGGPLVPEEAPAAAEPPAPVRTRVPRILRASRQRLQAMSVADAARQIDGGEGVVVFRDVETYAVSVLYRAPSGELTLVETEAK
jgi:putative sigma-54 modulation protein